VVRVTFLPLYSHKGAPGTPRIGGCVDTRAGLDALDERETYCLCQESNAGQHLRMFFYEDYMKSMERKMFIMKA
jgi:hypothetical protein